MGWLRDWTGRWLNTNSQQFLYAPIPRGRTDETFADAALEPYVSYLRLWLAEMHLAKGKVWGTKWFPAVNAEVELTIAGSNTASFPSILRLPDDKLGQGVQLNYRLTELLPYEGGTVEIDSALFALPGSGNFLASALDVLQSFSGLVPPPARAGPWDRGKGRGERSQPPPQGRGWCSSSLPPAIRLRGRGRCRAAAGISLRHLGVAQHDRSAAAFRQGKPAPLHG
jgi:hypothetical protein